MGLDGLGQPGDGGRDRQGSMDLSRHHALGHRVPVVHPQLEDSICTGVS